MQRFQYIGIDSILAKYHRDFRGVDITEDDAIEWIAEALGHAKVANTLEEAVRFVEIKDHQCDIPKGMHYITQIARNNEYDEDPEKCNPDSIIDDIAEDIKTEVKENEGENGDCINCEDEHFWLKNAVPVAPDGEILGDYEVAYYRPFFDLQYEYGQFCTSGYHRRAYTPVRLSDHSFFNTLVCREEEAEQLYSSSEDEYTIVQNKLRFSFKKGFVAIAYLRNPTDDETGYPLVPDDESARAALTYYLGWKIKERECWNSRQGACQLADKAEMRWLKYVKQFRNKAKMPYGVDQHENLKQGSMYLLPNNKRYNGFFGNLNRGEDRRYGNPDNRNQRYRNRRT